MLGDPLFYCRNVSPNSAIAFGQRACRRLGRFESFRIDAYRSYSLTIPKNLEKKKDTGGM
jgi:hypothetical protein